MSSNQMPSSPRSQQKPEKSALREYLNSIAFAIGILLIVRTFVGELFKSSWTAVDRLHDASIRDHWLVFKPAFLFSAPKRGELILHDVDGNTMISRVVGLPGEHVELSPAGIRINGSLRRETYVLIQGVMTSSLVVPERHVFVQPDRRTTSHASGSLNWGTIPYERIRGKYVLRWYPVGRIGWFAPPEE